MKDTLKNNSKDDNYLGHTYVAIALTAGAFFLSTSLTMMLVPFLLLAAAIVSWSAFARNKKHKPVKWFFQFPVALIITFFLLAEIGLYLP